MEQIVLQYVNTFNIKANIVRPFNLLGPGMPINFSLASFIQQIIQIGNSSKKEIKVGNLEPKRDFIDVRDAVDAYWKILNSDSFGGIYNIGSGESIKMLDALELIIELCKVKIEIVSESTRVRKNDIMNSQADITKLKELNWVPKISLRESLIDIIKKQK